MTKKLASKTVSRPSCIGEPLGTDSAIGAIRYFPLLFGLISRAVCGPLRLSASCGKSTDNLLLIL